MYIWENQAPRRHRDQQRAYRAHAISSTITSARSTKNRGQLIGVGVLADTDNTSSIEAWYGDIRLLRLPPVAVK